jgi:hypothetical protein
MVFNYVTSNTKTIMGIIKTAQKTCKPVMGRHDTIGSHNGHIYHTGGRRYHLVGGSLDPFEVLADVRMSVLLRQHMYSVSKLAPRMFTSVASEYSKLYPVIHLLEHHDGIREGYEIRAFIGSGAEISIPRPREPICRAAVETIDAYIQNISRPPVPLQEGDVGPIPRHSASFHVLWKGSVGVIKHHRRW